MRSNTETHDLEPLDTALPILDVADYRYEGGAQMDGTHDDGPAFRAALRHAQNIGGAIVSASPKGLHAAARGVAKISGQLLVPSNTTLDLRNRRVVRADVSGEALIGNVVGAVRPEVIGGDIDGVKRVFPHQHNRGIFWQHCRNPIVSGTKVRNTYAEAFRADAETVDFVFEDTSAIDIGTAYPANPDGNGYFIRSFSSGISIAGRLMGSGAVAAAKLFGLKNARPIWIGPNSLPKSRYETWTLTKLSGGTWSVTGSISGSAPNAAENVPYNNGKIAFTIVPQAGAFYSTADKIFIEVGPDGTGTNLGKSPNSTNGKLIRPNARNCALSSLVSYNAGNNSSILEAPTFSRALGGRHINLGAYSQGWKIISPDCRDAYSSIVNLSRVANVQVVGGALHGTTVDASGVGQYGQCVSIGPDAHDIGIDGTECTLAATDGVIVLPGSTKIRLKLHSHHNGQNLLASDGITPVRTGIHAGADGIRLEAGDGGRGILPQGDVADVDIGGSHCEFTQHGSGVRAFSDNSGANYVSGVRLAGARLDDNSWYGYDFDRYTRVVDFGNLKPLRNGRGPHRADPQ